jgi:hypothetical protein
MSVAISNSTTAAVFTRSPSPAGPQDTNTLRPTTSSRAGRLSDAVLGKLTRNDPAKPPLKGMVVYLPSIVSNASTPVTFGH